MDKFYPALFVFLWSTGFIGAKYGMPHAEPLTFLLARYALVIAIMTMVAFATRAPWPRNGRQWLHIGIAGILMHGIYLGGVFIAITHGLPAGVTSLVVGLQPLLTAIGANLALGEKVVPRQWVGLALGLIGTMLVLSGRVQAGFALDGLVPALVALGAITVGTLYQKRFCPHFDWRTGSVAQFIPAAILTLIVASFTEHFHIEFVAPFVFALAWLVLVLSLGAISLLNHLIRSGNAVNVASLFYLVPASTATIGWLVFNEALSPAALVGMATALGGVYLARR